MASSRTGATTKKRTAARSTRTTKDRPASAPRGAPTLADLRRIARSIVTSTSVMDERRMVSLYADSIESQEAGEAPTYGIDALRTKLERFNKRIASQRWHARNLWVDGQTVIVEWEAHLTLKPGSRKVVLHEIAIHEVRNGQIVRERFYYDPRILA
jgi:ketosteroid isomerase-like protein